MNAMKNTSPQKKSHQLDVPSPNIMNMTMVLGAIIVVAVIAAILLETPAEESFLPVCGDGECNSMEEVLKCPVDCPAPSEGFCGDGNCAGESCSSCPTDCGPCNLSVTLKLKGEIIDTVSIHLFQNGKLIETQKGNGPFTFEAPPGTITIEASNEKNDKVESLTDVSIEKDVTLTLTLPDDFFLTGRELFPNVFDESIGVATEDSYKVDGYVLIRYFYRSNCVECTNPVNWKSVLEDIAADMNGIVILELFDTKYKNLEFQKWGKTALNDASEPVIRLEGMPDGEHSYKIYAEGLLNQFYDNPKEKLSAEICNLTNQC
jgi:hypothetical protein